MAERLIIGVDFGTTYTGCGFVLSSKPASDIEVIKVWPNSDCISTEKVPSEFAYPTTVHNSSRKNKTPYVNRDIRFGLELSPTEARLSCVKLLLDHKQQLPSFASVTDIWGLLWQANRTPVDAVADFLSKIREYALSIVSDRYGNSLLQSIEVQYILTVPAMWSDAGKDKVIIAANRAGMGKNLRLISEPEAAAVHALKAIRANTLKVDDNVIVCDAGGGTVDLITYRLAQMDPLGVEEVVVGTGGFCGSAFLNHGFEDLIRNKLRPYKFWQLQQKPRAWREATKRFEEYVKRQFSEQGGQSEYHIPMPGMPDDLHEDMEDGFLILQRDEIKSVFDPVINQVINLIEGQVAAVHANDQMISAILLVGGFGQSRYLRERVAAHFATNHPPPYSVTAPVSGRIHGGNRRDSQAGDQMITILQPVDAWSAIVRGAITRGLDGTIVTSRRVRYHYGIAMQQTFNPHKHTKSQRVWDRLEEKYLAKDCMDWLLKKGTAVSEQRKVSLSCFITCEEHEMDDDHTTKVYFSSCERAPARFGPNVRSLCSLVADMSKVPRSRWSGPLTNSFGTRYYKLRFEIDMKIDSASMSFDLICRGISYGTVSASFDHPEGA